MCLSQSQENFRMSMEACVCSMQYTTKYNSEQFMNIVCSFIDALLDLKCFSCSQKGDTILFHPSFRAVFSLLQVCLPVQLRGAYFHQTVFA